MFIIAQSRTINLGNHYSENTFYYLKNRVKIVFRRIIKDRERTEIKIDF